MENVITNQNKALIEEAKTQFECGIKRFEKEDYKNALSCFETAHKLYISTKSIEDVSICLSWIGFVQYKLNPSNFFKVIIILNDAKFLAESTKSDKAFMENYYVLANISILEKNMHEALIYFERAKALAEENPTLQVKILKHMSKAFETIKEYKKSCLSLDSALKLIIENNFDKEKNEVEESIKRINNLIKLSNVATGNDSEPKTNSREFESDPMIALLKVARAVSAETDIAILLKTIAEQTKIALNADRCTVFLLDKSKNELSSKVALGLEIEEIRFPANKGLAGHVVRTGETVNIKDPYNDSRFNKEIDQMTGYITKNILCMPIKNMSHEIVGVFQVLNKRKGSFSKHDENLLIAIGSSAGIALENARLFETQQQMIETQKGMFLSFIDTLAASIDARDKITSGHSTRVKLYSKLICSELGLDTKSVEEIEHAAILHDIGKIGIRDSVLQKEGKLTPEEYQHIQEHVNITHDILSKIALSKDFHEVADIASSHHEKYDGTGYFRGLKGNDIPLGGRILAVSDVFDAITSKRHYRDKMPILNVIDILTSGAGKHFDSKIVDTFMSITTDKIVEVFLTEFDRSLEEKDRLVLQKYDMNSLHKMLLADQNKLSPEEKIFIETFNEHYTNKSSSVIG